jgi:cytidine deaminase
MPIDDATADELVNAAAEVRLRAHAPYSEFTVGAALLAADGRIFVGCNVENASYGLSVCAERHAVAAAVAAGSKSFRAVAVVTDLSPPAQPCGACRQVLTEFGDLEVISANSGGERRKTTISGLLPEAFGPESLGFAPAEDEKS